MALLLLVLGKIHGKVRIFHLLRNPVFHPLDHIPSPGEKTVAAQKQQNKALGDNHYDNPPALPKPLSLFPPLLLNAFRKLRDSPDFPLGRRIVPVPAPSDAGFYRLFFLIIAHCFPSLIRVFIDKAFKDGQK